MTTLAICAATVGSVVGAVLWVAIEKALNANSDKMAFMYRRMDALASERDQWKQKYLDLFESQVGEDSLGEFDVSDSFGDLDW